MFRTSQYSFLTKVNLENDSELYSACSDPTIVESSAALLAGVDRLISRIYRIWRFQYKPLLPIIILKTITETTLVGFEHSL